MHHGLQPNVLLIGSTSYIQLGRRFLKNELVQLPTRTRTQVDFHLRESSKINKSNKKRHEQTTMLSSRTALLPKFKHVSYTSLRRTWITLVVLSILPSDLRRLRQLTGRKIRHITWGDGPGCGGGRVVSAAVVSSTMSLLSDWKLTHFTSLQQQRRRWRQHMLRRSRAPRIFG